MNRRVLIGACLHTPPGSLRARVFPAWLAHLQALDLEGVEARYAFVLDKVESHHAGPHRRLLEAFPGASLLWVMDDDLPRPEAQPRPEVRPMSEVRRLRREVGDGYARMAFLRNLLRERALLEGADFLFSVDGDIMVPSNLLRAVVAEDRPWVSGLVCNVPPEDIPGWECWAWNVLNFTADLRRHFHIAPDLEKGGPCDVTGAVALYRHDLLQAARWAPDPGSEDDGFARLAKAAGFRGWYIPQVCGHLMTPALAEAHQKACGLPFCALAMIEGVEEGKGPRASNQRE